MHAVLLAAEEAHATTSGFPPALVGVIAFGALMALLAVTYAFRNAGHRHR